MTINIPPILVLFLATLLIYGGCYGAEWLRYKTHMFVINDVPNARSLSATLSLLLHASCIYLIYEVIRHVAPLINRG